MTAAVGGIAGAITAFAMLAFNQSATNLSRGATPHSPSPASHISSTDIVSRTSVCSKLLSCPEAGNRMIHPIKWGHLPALLVPCV